MPLRPLKFVSSFDLVVMVFHQEIGARGLPITHPTSPSPLLPHYKWTKGQEKVLSVQNWEGHGGVSLIYYYHWNLW